MTQTGPAGSERAAASAMANGAGGASVGKPDHGIWVLGVLSLLMGFASISTDIYLPAMPTIGQTLGASAGLVEWTISGYLLGFSTGQLLWGPLSDRHGRRLPIAAGMILFIVGSVGCALANSVDAIILWRVVQAFGGSAGVVLSRAMVRDLYEGHRAAQMLSTLITIMGIAPLLGPIVGEQLLALAGWRAIFWVLVLVGVLTLAALFTLPETLPNSRRSGEPLGRSFYRYLELLRHRRLLGYAAAGGFFYAGLFAYVAGTPFAYMTFHHLPPRMYPAVFSLGIFGIIGTNMLNARLVRRIGGDALLRRGTALAAGAGVAAVVAATTGWGGLAGLVVTLVTFMAATGLVVANSIAGALSEFPHRAGSASALVGALQYGCGILGSGAIGAFSDGTPRPMAIVILIAGAGSFVSARLIAPRAHSAS